MAVKDRVSAHRERMRAQGFRLVQVWVPDVRSKDFASEAHRQSVAVAATGKRSDDQEFVEAVSATWDE